LKLTYDEKKVILENIYAPNNDGPSFLMVFCTIAQFPKANIILGGD